MKALVLAAGKGIRMMPLTLETPKVLLNVAGKPFLHYVLTNLREAGFKDEDIYVMVCYKKEKIEEFVNETGFNVKLIDQGEILGTGHAVLKAERWIKENFVVVMGDNLYSASDINRISAVNEFCYIGAFESSHPQDYGVLELDGNKLVSLDEKPENPKSNLVNTGLYKFTPEIFGVLKTLKKSSRGEYEITDAFNKLALGGKIKVIKIKDYWIDMSTKSSLPEVEKQIGELFR